MSRLRRIADRDRIFFITTNLLVEGDRLAASERDQIAAQLSRQRAERDFLLFGYVVMPTHLHLLLLPERRSLPVLMYRFKRFTATQAARSGPREGKMWQARYFDFILRRAGDFWDKLAYIHENPVKAGLADKAEQWPWSSAAQWAAAEDGRCKIDRCELPLDRKAWLCPAAWR